MFVTVGSARGDFTWFFFVAVEETQLGLGLVKVEVKLIRSRKTKPLRPKIFNEGKCIIETLKPVLKSPTVN